MTVIKRQAEALIPVISRGHFMSQSFLDNWFSLPISASREHHFVHSSTLKVQGMCQEKKTKTKQNSADHRMGQSTKQSNKASQWFIWKSAQTWTLQHEMKMKPQCCWYKVSISFVLGRWGWITHGYLLSYQHREERMKGGNIKTCLILLLYFFSYVLQRVLMKSHITVWVGYAAFIHFCSKCDFKGWTF